MKYAEFINSCRTKDYAGFELHIHHIKPRSQGGSDKPKNLISLSVYDHFWAHVIYAEEFNKCMTAPSILLWHYKARRDFTPTQWDEAYKIALELNRGRTVNDVTRKKIGASKVGNQNMLGKHHTRESKEKISIKNFGNKHTGSVIKIIGLSSKAM